MDCRRENRTVSKSEYEVLLSQSSSLLISGTLDMGQIEDRHRYECCYSIAQAGSRRSSTNSMGNVWINSEFQSQDFIFGMPLDDCKVTEMTITLSHSHRNAQQRTIGSTRASPRLPFYESWLGPSSFDRLNVAEQPGDTQNRKAQPAPENAQKAVVCE